MNRHFAAALLAFGFITQPHAQSAGTGRLNDTGMTACRVGGAWTTACEGTGQDADHGRDVAKAKPSDGRAGFSWQKLDAAGADLPPAAAGWTCVRDKVTGLVWEVKTDDGGLRDKDRVYQRSQGAVEAYVIDVNKAGLCGRTDWRLPTRAELSGLVDFSKLPGEGIDTAWFPHPPSVATWTSSCATCNYYNWAFMAQTDPSNTDYFTLAWYEEALALRLVSDAGRAPASGDRYVLDGGEATDKVTGLVWRRCAEGTAFGDGLCSGEPRRLGWTEALAHAAAQARITGQAWRLPNVKELDSLLDLTREASFDAAAFPGLGAAPYWTSTAHSQQPSRAWCVNFGNARLTVSHEYGEGCKPRSRTLLVRTR